MKKMLLIIDPQYDFISGSIGSMNAISQMDNLAHYLKKNKDEYDIIAFTLDWHPINHQSLKKNGGEWENHCIQHSFGAAIYQPLLDAIINSKAKTLFLQKGDSSDKEEYSFLQNEVSAMKFFHHLSQYHINHIDICGIANEYCVLHSVKDLVEKHHMQDNISILSEYVVAIKESNVLFDYASKNNIRIV